MISPILLYNNIHSKPPLSCHFSCYLDFGDSFLWSGIWRMKLPHPSSDIFAIMSPLMHMRPSEQGSVITGSIYLNSSIATRQITTVYTTVLFTESCVPSFTIWIHFSGTFVWKYRNPDFRHIVHQFDQECSWKLTCTHQSC